MTSQIAVFNLECVAIASDSVLTVSNGRQERTLSSSEKVFDLGAGHKILAVASGEARFMKVPWTLLLREWSIRLTEPLGSVADYANDLVGWLQSQDTLFPEEEQERFFGWQLRDYYLAARRQILNELAERELEDAPWDALDVQKCVNEIVQANVDRLRERAFLTGTDEARNAMRVATDIDVIPPAFDFVFDDVPRTSEADELLKLHIPALILGRHEPFSYDSVIALIGYGANDLFPGHQVIEFHGMVAGEVRCWWWKPKAVSPSGSTMITPLAQTDAISTFLQAYHDDFLDQAHRTLDAVLDVHLVEDEPEPASVHDHVTLGDIDDDEEFDEAKAAPTARQIAHDRLNDDFESLSWERFVSPMLSTVDALPRADMARMAESLVGIQALRAASMGTQPTVGGPIDVAVISRAHGVQWLRRKELTLN